MSGPIRVLHVMVNMNRGGAETLIMNLYRNIDRSKVQFDFLTCKEGIFDEEILEMGGEVHRIPYISEAGHNGYMKALNNFFHQHTSYSIVHSHMDKMSGLVLREARKADVLVRIAHSHNTSSEGNVVAKLYKWYAGNNILPNATDLMACSDKAAKWLFTKQAKQALIIKNGVDLKKFSFSYHVRDKVRRRLGLKQGDFVVGHVGRFYHQKNHVFLIESFHELVKKRPDAILLLIGDGALRPDIEEKVASLNLKNSVLFLGIRSDIHEILQAFDIFVFPSLHEGLPVTLIEAQAIGLPCIVANTITDEVDVGAGLISFLELGDSQKWADEMILQKKQLHNISGEYIRKAGFDISMISKDIEEHYKYALIKNGKKGKR